MIREKKNPASPTTSRRRFLQTLLVGGFGIALGAGWKFLLPSVREYFGLRSETFVAAVSDYDGDLASIVYAGMRELGVTNGDIQGKNILLKPNLVEPHRTARHINTHPLVVRGAVEAFMRMGAARVVVAEGSGHYRDTHLVLEESGMIDVMREDKISFHDMNNSDWFTIPNQGGNTRLSSLTFSSALRQADWIVSMPKLKTHRWTGVTLSMKNMFGVMPGMFYGWPKNVLHVEGIDRSIIDINMTMKPHFAIVDGIIGMDGNGPIMGNPRQSGVIVLGRNPVSVDATCSRIMGIDPYKVPHLKAARGMGPIRESYISQRGEAVSSVRTDFELLDNIQAHRGLRWR
ncbi:MAG TPA: DUF362 domain-containing protein [Acidobacteriota bacterium]|nr:DUF362 domain-containing protein [Acidobacteriota bacterium]